METQRVVDDAEHPFRRFSRWLLVSGDRSLVASVLLAGIGATFAVAGALRLASVTTQTWMMWYLNGTINGLLTLVPITVGVNQIILSHEFGSIDDLYERRTDVTEFRERVEATTGAAVSSPYASTFFTSLLSALAATAGALRERHDATDEGGDRTGDVAAVTRSIVDEAEQTNRELEENDVSTLDTLRILLDFEDSELFHGVRRLQNEPPGYDEETTTELDRIEELFVEIDTARQFLKTTVVERQLALLSRRLIYTGIPAVVIAVVGIFSYETLTGLGLSRLVLVGIAGGLVVITLAPLVLLGTYILRVATIARRTAMFGPFVPESND